MASEESEASSEYSSTESDGNQSKVFGNIRNALTQRVSAPSSPSPAHNPDFELICRLAANSYDTHYEAYKSSTILDVGRGALNSMRQGEIEYRPNENYLSQQECITAQNRAVLLDWMMEVCAEYTLKRSTYYKAVNFVDRFLSVSSLSSRTNLQLLGTTTLFIASKLEEIHAPRAKHFVAVTAGTCQLNQLLEMEPIVLEALEWKLYPPTVYEWAKVLLEMMEKYCRKSGRSTNQRPQDYPSPYFIRVMELIDLVYLDAECLKFLPSEIAASALCVVVRNDDILPQLSRYTREDLESCISWMQEYECDLNIISKDPPQYTVFRQEIISTDQHTSQLHYPQLLQLYHNRNKKKRDRD